MNTKKHIYTAFVLAVLVGIGACSDLEEMNIDPNKTQTVPTSALLTQAQANLVYNFNGEIAQLGSQYVQHFAQLDYPDKSNYAEDGISSFNSVYLGGLKDLQEIKILNTAQESKERVSQYGDNNNQVAVAAVLNVWAYHNMTDVWGDIPYAEAINDDILMPAYDMQADIYDGLFQDLKDAQALIDMSPVIDLKGDMIFNGDMDMWYAFAESMKIRIAMRLTEVDDAKAKAMMQEVDFTKAFSLSTHFAHFGHLETENEANPLYIDNVVNLGADFFAVANTFVDALNSMGDPRIASFANPAINSGLYVGHTYGIEGTGNAADVSMPGDKYAAQAAPTVIMTAAEILLAKAEAIQRNYISGDAAAAYRAAITVSMEYNGVDAGDIATYLARSEVTYDPAKWRSQIGTQKWIALYAQGIQAWAEWRRLDYPVLTPGPAAVKSTIPRRRAYGSSEYTTNEANVSEAVSRLATGKDLFTEKVWWDK